MKYFLLFGLVFILSACGTPVLSTPALTPRTINIVYPAALQIWADNIANCASDDPQVDVFFFLSDTLGTDVGQNDIVLELGNPDINIDGIYLSQVGWEQVIVIVNKKNPIAKLSNEELGSVFSDGTIQSDVISDQSIQVWVLPAGEPTRSVFDLAVMQNQLITTQAMLAPDPSAMLEAVSQNTDAIGYLPESFFTTADSSLTSEVKIIQLESSLEDLMNQPVLAITQSEPEGLLRNLLVCLEATTR
jgi:PBP superfamily domain